MDAQIVIEAHYTCPNCGGHNDCESFDNGCEVECPCCEQLVSLSE